MVAIRIPGPFRRFTGDATTVTVPAATVGAALQALVGQHEGLAPHLYDNEGRLHGFVNVFLNRVDVRTLQAEATAVQETDEIVLLPSIAGG